MAGNENVLRQLLGKTIKGIVVKRNTGDNSPMGQVILVFTDDTAFEVYSDLPISTANGLDTGGMKRARSYLSPPHGTMEISMEASLEDAE